MIAITSNIKVVTAKVYFSFSQMMPPSMGIPSLLASISQAGQRPNTSHSHGGRRSRSDTSSILGRSSHSQARRFQRMFDSMKNEVQASHVGLMSSASDVIEQASSRYLFLFI